MCGKNVGIMFVAEQEPIPCTLQIEPGLAPLRSPGTGVKGLKPLVGLGALRSSEMGFKGACPLHLLHTLRWGKV